MKQRREGFEFSIATFVASGVYFLNDENSEIRLLICKSRYLYMVGFLNKLTISIPLWKGVCLIEW